MQGVKKINCLVLFSLFLGCWQGEEQRTKNTSPCEDPTDIYCLLRHFYIPEIRYPDTPVLLFEYADWYLMHKQFEQLVRPFLHDSLKLSKNEISEMDSSLSVMPLDIHTTEDFKKSLFLHDTSWHWDVKRLPGFKAVTKVLLDSVNRVFFEHGYAQRQQLARQLFPGGYIVLSKPVMSKNGNVIHLYEQYYNRSENDYTRFLIFYRDKKLGWQLKMLYQ